MAADAPPPRPSPRVRLFIALWPPPAVRAALAARRDAIDWPAGAAPVSDERLHLTLHFLGALPIERLTDLVPALAVPWQPFELRLGDALRWPRGLLVLPAQPPAPALLALHRALAARLTGLGLAVESRPYRPHVTVARRADDARLPPPSGDALRWRPGGHVLVRSDPVSGYQVLARYGPRGVTIAATARRTATARKRSAPGPTPR
jgi:2'-5' RNA ligase